MHQRAASLEVAAGVLYNSAGEVLIAQRPRHLHQGGLWEFPGGKLESGESPEQALRRELAEELDIRVITSQPLMTVQHDYPEFHVTLHVFEVHKYQGQPRSADGQVLRWLRTTDLPDIPMPAADRPVISALRLPHTYVISPDCLEPTAYLQQLAQLLQKGQRFIQLRSKNLAAAELEPLVEKAQALCQAHDAALLLNGPISLVRKYALAGVHLSSSALLGLAERPLSARRWVGASCHNPVELRHAQMLGVDFVCLSPVLGTSSHPEAEPLGWSTFSDWVKQTNLPVFALGGMRPEQAVHARQAGAQGVAGISGFWVA